MANQVAAILSGEDYQHLFSFLQVLELLMRGKQVSLVRVEDEDAGSADDVTVYQQPDSPHNDRFYQIKYHVDHSGHYSTDYFIEHEPKKSSLLKKLFRSWKALQANRPGRPIEIHLVSNWGWDSSDKLKTCISGESNAFSDRFVGATSVSDIGKLRQKWFLHLDAEAAEVISFCDSLRFKLAYACWNEMANLVSERMSNLGLKSDRAALKVAAGIVREWIRSRTGDITRHVVEAALHDHDLYLPPEAEPSVDVYLTTIKEQRFDIEPDYVIDWRDRFLGTPNKRGHDVKDEAAWNDDLLPDLEAFEARINVESPSRLIRARGLARLSAWLAFGHTFSEVNRYTIEIDQQGKLWRSDAPVSPNLRLISTSQGGFGGELVDGDGHTVAVGISVAGSLDDDVRQDLRHRNERVASLLLIRPERPLSHDCLSCEGDAVALALECKQAMLAFVKKWNATRLRIYYYGPISGACFIGHRLNAVCREVQVMEHQQPGYLPPFLLRL
jgi:hypothetical protein